MWILKTSETTGKEDGTLVFRVLPGGVKTIGRASAADFIIDAGMVSRFHCRLTSSEAGQLELQDLNSTNGTFVNGNRVKKTTLQAGDWVRVGRVELVVARQPTRAR